MAIKPVSVSQLNSYIKRTLASDPILSNIVVKGEISKLTVHSSGHWYFTLKDESSRISCFLPADRAAMLRFEFEDGMEISAAGYVSVYEKGGYYSLNIKDMQPEGEGALKLAFDKLKAKLQAEGLFDPAVKKSIPAYPKTVGIITSPTGAAVRDIITTIKRRYPLTDIVVYPCLVQGDKAAASIAYAIEQMNSARLKADVLIVGRGGGSAEDLWAFNQEAVARAVFASEIPVISAVGHEVDYVISDYAADLRAATPTAAAELAVPDIRILKSALEADSPQRLAAELLMRTQMLSDRMLSARSSCLSSYTDLTERLLNRLSMLESDCRLSSPRAVFERGYAAVSMDGRWISSIDALSAGDRIKLTLADGSLDCLVEGRSSDEKERA